MWTHRDIERKIDPFSCYTFNFEVWPFVTIPIQSCLIDKIYEKLLCVIYKLFTSFVVFCCVDKNYNIFQITRFNHTMILYKLFD